MRRLIKNTKGAVTVFVTLLLIPAMLISGTAVDMARMHTARSIVQDANQLAANAVLTRYDALLKDLYGLFGVKLSDPELAGMINDYIAVSIFGEDWNDKSPGTLQLFYGSMLQAPELQLAEGKDLRNEDVLRRQIEDYMKYRAPVIIVKELLDVLTDNNLKGDTKVIGEKLELDESITELCELYKKLYEAITAADKCTQAVGGIAGGHFGSVSTSLTAIHAQFNALYSTYKYWELCEPPDEDDPSGGEDAFDYELLYSAILQNIQALTVGGPRGSNWSNGGWSSYYTVVGLNTNIANAKIQSDNFKPKFDAVLTIANEIDSKLDELSGKIDSLERAVTSGGCSDDMKKALTSPGSDGKSQLEIYKGILEWKDVAGMASVFKKGGYSYIDDSVKPMLDDVKYRNSGNLSGSSLTREQLAAIVSNPAFALSSSATAESSRAAYFAKFPEANVTYKMPPGFLKFAAHPGENGRFYDYLKKMIDQPELDPVALYNGQSSGGSGDGEAKQKSMIKKVLEMAESAYDGLKNEPLGAKYIRASGSATREKLGIIEIVKLIPKALSEPVVDIITSPVESLAKAGDYMLLLTYCTSMFSNYSTARPDANGKKADELGGISLPKSLAGIPMSPKVNYFFQSEWEYLYKGSTTAGENLNAVTKLIFLVRLICNYISVFRVPEVNNIVTGIRTAFSWCPPLGVTLAELARAAFVAAETVVDVSSLRSGHKVPLLKSPETGGWKCRPSGLAELLKNAAEGDVGGQADEKGLSYSNYMVFFFLTKALFSSGASSELAKRASDLIEWNVINYRNGINANEGAMGGAIGSEGVFKLADMKTDFRISSTVSMRMLFLSMPMAQKGVGGVIPPKTYPLTAVDYRGY